MRDREEKIKRLEGSLKTGIFPPEPKLSNHFYLMMMMSDEAKRTHHSSPTAYYSKRKDQKKRDRRDNKLFILEHDWCEVLKEYSN